MDIARLLPTFVLDGLKFWYLDGLIAGFQSRWSLSTSPFQEAQDGFIDDLEMELERMMDEPWFKKASTHSEKMWKAIKTIKSSQ